MTVAYLKLKLVVPVCSQDVHFSWSKRVVAMEPNLVPTQGPLQMTTVTRPVLGRYLSKVSSPSVDFVAYCYIYIISTRAMAANSWAKSATSTCRGFILWSVPLPELASALLQRLRPAIKAACLCVSGGYVAWLKKFSAQLLLILRQLHAQGFKPRAAHKKTIGLANALSADWPAVVWVQKGLLANLCSYRSRH